MKDQTKSFLTAFGFALASTALTMGNSYVQYRINTLAKENPEFFPAVPDKSAKAGKASKTKEIIVNDEDLWD